MYCPFFGASGRVFHRFFTVYSHHIYDLGRSRVQPVELARACIAVGATALSIATLRLEKCGSKRAAGARKIYMISSDWCGPSHMACHFLPDFQQQKTLSQIDNAGGSDNMRHKASDRNFLRHTEAG
jgi:hypothetical protein